VRATQSAAAAPIRPRRWTRSTKRNLRNGLLFISPWIVGTLVLTVYPIVASLYYSFTDYNVVSPPKWIGLGNYTELFGDPQLIAAIKNTLYYAALYVPLTLVVSVAIAMLLNLQVRGVTIYRAIFFLPYTIPQVVLAILWAWILNPQFGIANRALAAMDLPQIGWLSDPSWSKPSLVLMGLWASIGGTVIIFLAGLKDISRQLYEAAEIDGAGAVRRTFHITLPMLTPTIFYNLILGVIGALQTFTTVYVVSNGEGGPLNSTMFYGLLLYQNAFRYFRMGYASAMAWLLFVFIFVLTLILFKTSNRWVHYEGDARNG
jgi:multiple sugar transport system permease protein